MFAVSSVLQNCNLISFPSRYEKCNLFYIWILICKFKVLPQIAVMVTSTTGPTLCLLFLSRIHPYYSQLEYWEGGDSVWTKVPWKRTAGLHQLQDLRGHGQGADQKAGRACCPETQGSGRHVLSWCSNNHLPSECNTVKMLKICVFFYRNCEDRAV